MLHTTSKNHNLLHLAVTYNNLVFTQWLLESSNYDRILLTGKSSKGLTPIYQAVKCVNYEMVKQLLATELLKDPYYEDVRKVFCL